jgi:hypothetical protein
MNDTPSTYQYVFLLEPRALSFIRE